MMSPVEMPGAWSFRPILDDPLIFARAVHDLKNPAQAIQCCIEMMRGELSDYIGRNVDLDEMLSSAEESVLYLLSLVEKIVDMEVHSADRTSINMERLDPLPLIEKIVLQNQPSAKKNGIRIEIKKSDENFGFLGNAIAFNSCLDNLLSNAIKYSPTGGQISICLESKDKLLSIGVRDSGGGIPEEEIHLLFRPFSRLSTNSHCERQGTGLGLNIVKNLMEAQKGRALFENSPDGGSVFTLEFRSWH